MNSVLKYSIVYAPQYKDQAYTIYKRVLDRFKNLEESKNSWDDFDILIYLRRGVLNFGEYNKYYKSKNEKPKYTKIQTDKNAYIGRVPFYPFIGNKSYFNYNHFDFYPYSFTVKNKTDLKNKDLKKYKYWIIKPSEGLQGNDITISKNTDVFSNIEKYKDDLFPLEVQRYIDNPLLLNGHKFDFRAYILYIDDEIYLNDYYYVRMASKPYDYDNPTDRLAGLTNFSIHKNYEYFLTRDQFLEEYKKQYPKNSASFLDHKLLKKFSDISVETFKYIREKTDMSFTSNKKNHYFNIFGVDFLPDETGKIYLLEINPNPGFGDLRKNSQAEIVVTDMLRLIIDKKENKPIKNNSFHKI